MTEIPELGDYSPVQVFAVLLLLISVVEFGIIRLLLASLNPPPLLEALMHSILLTLIVAPAIYLLLIRPAEKLSREEVERSYERYRTVVESSTDAIVSANESRRIVQWNEAATEMFGYSEEEALGQLTDILVPTELREDHVEGFERFVETEELRVLDKNYETRGLRKDGSTFPIELSSSYVRRDEGSFFFTAIIRDITDRKEAEEALGESEERFRRIVERTYDLIVTLDPSGRVVFVSSSVERVLGYAEEEMKGRHFREFITEEDVGRAEEVFREVLDGDTVEGIVLRLHGKRRREVEVEVNAVPIEEDEGSVQVVFRDTTEVKEREQQLMVLGRVLRHNLHNDMNLILGHAENMLEKTGSDDAEEIMEAANRLIETTDKEKEIIDIISKVGGLEVLDVKELVGRAIEKVESNYPETEVTVHSMPEETLEIEALPELERALYELLENAIIHTETDEPKVEISIGANDTVEISVKDRGETIPDDEAKVLTRKSEVSSMYHGSGLGLWLVSWIIRKSNGELEFQEDEPSGNIITLRLPRPDETVSG